MPIPTFTVTGTVHDVEGSFVDEPDAVLDFIPNFRGPVIWGGEVYYVKPISVPLDADGGVAPLELLANDPGLNVGGIQWRVTVRIPGVQESAWWFDAPLDGQTVDLAVVAHAPLTLPRGLPGLQPNALLALLEDDDSDLRQLLDDLYEGGGGGGGGGMDDLVDDTTPQLGGNLDLNGKTVGDATAGDLTKLHALAATAVELNYTDGVTSSIQAQLDAKSTPASVAAGYQPLDADLTALAALTTPATKLSGIEALADVTDSTNVDAAGAVMNADTSTAAMGFVVDDDTMAGASDTKVPTAQSVKAYVDNAGLGGGGGITEISQDTSPTLGGNLDLTGYNVGPAEVGDLVKLHALTATSTELNYVDGVTSDIQTQLDGKQAADADLTALAALTAPATKLAGIEALADVTDSTNVDAAGAVMNADTSTVGMSFVVDEDNMASNSATKLPTQQSVKAYVDNAGLGGGGGITEISQDTTPQLGGDLDLNTHTVGDATAADLTKLHALTATSTELNYVDGVTSDIQTQLNGKQAADADLTTIAGLTATTDSFMQAKGSAWAARTVAQVKTDLGLTGTNSGDQDLSSYATTAAVIAGYQPLDADLTALAALTAPATKLNGIEALADVTDAANVDAAGAVMNSDTSTASMSFVVDEDNMASDSATKVPTQQSVKAYADGKQPLDADLTTIAGLTATTDSFIQSKGSAWAARTVAQVKTDLGLTGTNSGDQTTVTGNAGTATALATARNIDGQSFNGTADITVIAPGTHAATSKATPVDADEVPLVDSAASNVLKRLTWANVKATLKTYFDSLYYIVGGGDVAITDGGTGVSTLPSGLLKGAGTGAITAASAGTDFVAPGGALGTPSSGNASNLTSFPTLNQNTSGSAATLTTPRTINGVSFNGSANIVAKNVGGITSSATPSIDCAVYGEGQYNITALAVNITGITVTNAYDGCRLAIRFTGTATRTIVHGSSFQSSGVATLLATTSGTNTHLAFYVYDGVKSKFVCYAVDSVGC